MSPFSPRVALPLLVIVGVAAGCASSQARRAPESNNTTVTSEDLRDRSAEPIEMLLQRKVPGLIVAKTQDGGISLQIRGSSSFQGRDTPPLYILNGLPFAAGPGGALTGIDAEDIDTVKVLRGAEAVIYGIDGANGVIVITTKTGGKPRT